MACKGLFKLMQPSLISHFTRKVNALPGVLRLYTNHFSFDFRTIAPRTIAPWGQFPLNHCPRGQFPPPGLLSQDNYPSPRTIASEELSLEAIAGGGGIVLGGNSPQRGIVLGVILRGAIVREGGHLSGGGELSRYVSFKLKAICIFL